MPWTGEGVLQQTFKRTDELGVGLCRGEIVRDDACSQDGVHVEVENLRKMYIQKASHAKARSGIRKCGFDDIRRSGRRQAGDGSSVDMHWR